LEGTYFEDHGNGMFEDEDGSLWVVLARYPGAEGPLCKVNDFAAHCFGAAEGMPFQRADSVLPDGKGGLWIGTDTSLVRWKSGRSEVYECKALRSNVGQDGIVSLVPDFDGSLWVGIAKSGPGRGLVKFVERGFKPFLTRNFDGSEISVSTLFMDRDQNLWVGTNTAGLYRIHGETVDHFGMADGLSSDTVFGLYEDREGTIWVATSSGLDSFTDRTVTTFSHSEGLPSDLAVSVMASRDGTVWVANLSSLDFIRNGEIFSIRSGQGLPGDQVTSLYEDRAGRMWVGVDDGLFLYEGHHFRRVPEPNQRPLGMINSITEDIDGNIWATSHSNPRKLIRIRDFEVKEEFTSSPLASGRVLAADPKGGIWMSTLAGDVVRFQNRAVQTFQLKLRSPAHQIEAERDGSILIAAPTEGLIGLRNGTLRRLTKQNGLPCDGVLGFIQDDRKNLWLEAPCGYIVVADSEMQRWWGNPDTVVHYRLFDAFDGARTRIVTFNPATKSPDGRLWFASFVLQTIDPGHILFNKLPPPVHIERITADRKSYDPASYENSRVPLPARIRDLQVDYTALSLVAPERVQFRYKLEGWDRDWQNVGNRRQAFYNNLPPRNYRFRVMASNNSGVWNETGASLDISIAAAYYQTTWFRLSCVTAFLGLLWGLYQLRLRRLAQELRKSERELQNVIDATPALIHSARPDGCVDFLNKGWLDFFGLALEEVVGWGWTKTFHPDDVDQCVDKWRAALASGEPFEAEARARRADGEYRTLVHRKVPLRDERGNIVRWYGTSFDIEDRKRAEARVEQAYLRLAEAQRLSKTGSYITDLVADEHNFSEETFRIFELDPAAKITLQMVRDMIHPEDQPTFDAVIARAMTGADFEFGFRIVTSRGAVKYLRGVTRVMGQNAGHPVFIGALQDITESKLAEEALNRARSELAHVARVATLNALTASIAHEVNQPLSGIITNASTCRRMLDADPPNIDGARETARRIIRDGNRASNVIIRLRAMFSKKDFTLEPLDLNEATREVIALSLSDLQRNRVVVLSDLAEDLPPVIGDRVQLQQVILNLLRNGADAMSTIEDRPRELLVRTDRKENDQVRLTVKDVGVGLTHETADKLFEAFYTTKKDGMGIGLSVSRSIIEKHNGRLWAEPNAGPGATFSFSIPCAPRSPTAAASQ